MASQAMNVALGNRGRPGLVGSGHAMAENAVDEVQAAQRPAPAAAEAPKKKRGRPPGQSIKGQRRPLGKRSMEKQPAVSEAARLLLDVSDRIPFTAVKCPTPKIWRSFELRAKKAQSTQDVITELLWFSAQLKRGVFSRAWMDAQQSDWIQDCGRCRGADEGNTSACFLSACCCKHALQQRASDRARGRRHASDPPIGNAGHRLECSCGALGQRERMPA